MEYSELLKHPKWQRKRLEVLERDRWQCKMCGAQDRTLHVHHKRYIKGRNPWEYALEDLESLCDECHSMIHQIKDRLDALDFAGKEDFLREIIGTDTPYEKRGAFAIFSHDIIPFESVVFHIPSGFWNGFTLTPEEVCEKLDSDPSAKDELREMILQGASRTWAADQETIKTSIISLDPDDPKPFSSEEGGIIHAYRSVALFLAAAVIERDGIRISAESLVQSATALERCNDEIAFSIERRSDGSFRVSIVEREDSHEEPPSPNQSESPIP